MRVNIANIVQEQAKMLHETNFDDKVRFVDFPLYKRKGQISLCPQIRRIFTTLLLEACGEITRGAKAHLIGYLAHGFRR